MISTCSLDTPEVSRVLERLHREAAGQKAAFVPIAMHWGLDALLRRKPSVEEEARRFKDLYIPLSPESGRFAYLVARSLGATRIVEFGTSFGISTLYLAAAVKDNGGGLVIGSEIEPGKVAQARRHLEEAGLEEYAEIREGDAQQTLADPGGTVDMALLDGWKDLYVPIFELLAPHLRPGAVVLGDNMKTFPKALAPYAARVREAGFRSVTLPLGSGTEFSVKLP
ncbi:MAG: class I SAM-dependent methyltransferase [Deltaproteobacteria bacterium]|nr:class I SAM-dependent methyltransferase [Deltaproteobacteria bacterium]MBW2444518.1 class I SAM-dependent methyltransferase [Deltaproteobacteria bacterium]